MPLRALIVIAGLMVFAAPDLAAAQATQPPEVGNKIVPAPVNVQRRIEIRPGHLLYRQCTDWYELQYRQSGTVLYPGKHCWWVRD